MLNYLMEMIDRFGYFVYGDDLEIGIKLDYMYNVFALPSNKI
jgi:hypothetical protein